MSDNNFEKQFERAVKAGEEANSTEVRAVSARYDQEKKMIVIDLKNGGAFSFPIAWVSRLRDASDSELAEIEITPSGEGLHWEKLDEDLSVPALISGIYGPDRYDAAVLARLVSDLEADWFSQKDPTIVDRLAGANPLYAADLYEVFGFLVDSEIDQADGRAAEMADATGAWLEAEGLADVHKIAEGNRGPVTTNPVVTDAASSSSETVTPESEASEQGLETSGNVLTFPDLLRQRKGLDPDEGYETMGLPEDLIFIVQQQPAGKQMGIKNEIANRAAARFGFHPAESTAALEAQWLRAARDRSNAPGPKFRKQLAALGMSDEQLKYWLDLADEED